MPYPYQILDVFTDTPLAGNPLAVVFEAAGIDGKRMQAIAGEFNLSETIFIAPPEGASASVRIFTPRQELPFAGHPTVGGAAALAARLGGVDAVELIMPAGRVSASVSRRGNVFRAAFDAPSAPQIVAGGPTRAEVAEALGLDDADIGFGAFVPVAATSGPNFAIAPVRDVDALARIRLDVGAFARGSLEDRLLYAVTADGAGYRARAFAPQHSIAEDPATGSAAVAFAAVLAEQGGLGDGRHEVTIAQGIEMGRPSTIGVEMDIEGGAATRVRVSGDAVVVAEGTLAI